MVDINTQTTGSFRISSVEELLKLASNFGKQLGDLSGSLWLWRISTVTSLALGTLFAFVAANENNFDERFFAILLTGAAVLVFVFSVIRWSSISGQISNVTFLHQRAIEILQAAI